MTALVGGILGGLLALLLLSLLLCLIIYFCCCRRKNSKTTKKIKETPIVITPINAISKTIEIEKAKPPDVVEKTEITNIAETSSFTAYHHHIPVPVPIPVTNLSRVNSQKICCCYNTNNNNNKNNNVCHNNIPLSYVNNARSVRSIPAALHRTCCCDNQTSDLDRMSRICQSARPEFSKYNCYASQEELPKNLDTNVTINQRRQLNNFGGDFSEMYSSTRGTDRTMRKNGNGDTYLNVLTVYPDPEDSCENIVDATFTTNRNDNKNIYNVEHFDVPIEIQTNRVQHRFEYNHDNNNDFLSNRNFNVKSDYDHNYNNNNNNEYNQYESAGELDNHNYIQNRQRVVRREVEESFNHKIRQDYSSNFDYNNNNNCNLNHIQQRYESYI